MKPIHVRRTPRVRRTSLAAASLASLLALSACGGSDSSADSAGGKSLSADATKEEYAAALAEMDPVELKVQVLTPKEAGYSKAWEDYGKALDEWSGGKLTVKMHYSGAIVPTDVPGALSDGLIDAAPFQPNFEPDSFPVHSFLSERSVNAPNTPLGGALNQWATWTEVGYEDALVKEIEDNGIHPLVPVVMSGGPFQLVCKKPHNTLDSLKGASIRASSEANEAEIKALGATPVSLPTLEVFEGLQRGTIDCAVLPTTLAYAINIAEVAPHWTSDPRGGFAATHETLGVSMATWDDLPVAAQQLMHDRLDAFFATYMPRHTIGAAEVSMQQLDKANGELHTWDDAAWKKLDEHHDKVMTDLSDAPEGVDAKSLVASIEESQEKWGPTVDDLGYPVETTWADLVSTLEEEPHDAKPLFEELRTEVLDEHRPE